MGSFFDIRIILEGRQFDKAEDIKFTSAGIRYSYLEEWLDTYSGFRISPAITERGIDVSYRQPNTINTHINQDYSLEIQSNFKALAYLTLSIRID